MASRLVFTKMQGVGNDFVLVDARKFGGRDWSGLAMELCDRRTGIGADGLLVLDDTAFADVMMRMYNPDGTPDVCGNGLRCVARYAVERGLVEGDSLRIGTLAGTRAAQVHRDGECNIQSVTVSMGQPRFDPDEIPLCVAQEPVIDFPLELDADTILPITALSTGSTHAITFGESLPDDDRFFALSPQVENHPLFPDRTSLMWCVLEDSARLRMRIWERGAGETWGCGTGACAAAVAAILHGWAAQGEPVTVASRGGELIIRWREDAPIEMTGPAVFVFEGVYPLERS
jgi:diaminopimelate epimerase